MVVTEGHDRSESDCDESEASWVVAVVGWSILGNPKVGAGKYLLLMELMVILDSPYFLQFSSSSLPHETPQAKV